jgi:hypothetical protein
VDLVEGEGELAAGAVEARDHQEVVVGAADDEGEAGAVGGPGGRGEDAGAVGGAVEGEEAAAVDVEVGRDVDVRDPGELGAVGAPAAGGGAAAVVLAGVGEALGRRAAADVDGLPAAAEPGGEVGLDLLALLPEDLLEGLLGGEGEAVVAALEEAGGDVGAVVLLEEAPEPGALVVVGEAVVGVEDVGGVELLEVVEALAGEVADELLLAGVEGAGEVVGAALPPPGGEDGVLEGDEPAGEAEGVEVGELDLVDELVAGEPGVPAVAGLDVDEDAVAERFGEGEGARLRVRGAAEALEGGGRGRAFAEGAGRADAVGQRADAGVAEEAGLLEVVVGAVEEDVDDGGLDGEAGGELGPGVLEPAGELAGAVEEGVGGVMDAEVGGLDDLPVLGLLPDLDLEQGKC